MNRGLNFYAIILVTIATLVFSVSQSGVGHATTGIDLGNNPAQSNQVPGLNSNPNNNDDDNNNDDKSTSSSNGDNNNNDDKSTSSTSSTSSSTSSSSRGDVPMALPFNSNMADESNNEKDYSSVIPFP